MDKETWMPVPSMPGVMASSHGRIKLPERTTKMPHGGVRKYITKPLFGVKTKASASARHEYFAISSMYFGQFKVHRAVCEAFHGPAPTGKPVVLHLDENALNNRPGNLKWGTQKENLNAPGFIEYCKSRTGENNPYLRGRKITRPGGPISCPDRT